MLYNFVNYIFFIAKIAEILNRQNWNYIIF